MSKLFSTPIESIYTITAIIILVMILFPPVYSLYEGTPHFRGYELVFDLRRSWLIDLGRLSLQFIALGIVVTTIKRAIPKK